jgi:hypothetical protein
LKPIPKIQTIQNPWIKTVPVLLATKPVEHLLAAGNNVLYEASVLLSRTGITGSKACSQQNKYRQANEMIRLAHRKLSYSSYEIISVV